MISVQIKDYITCRIGDFVFWNHAPQPRCQRVCHNRTAAEFWNLCLPNHPWKPLDQMFSKALATGAQSNGGLYFRKALCAHEVLLSREPAGWPEAWWKFQCLLPHRALTCFSSPTPPPPPPRTTPVGTKPSGTHGGKLMTTISWHSWTETNSFHTALACNQMVLCALLICNCPPLFIFFYS